MIFKLPDLICAFSQKPRNMSFAYGRTHDSLGNRKEFLGALGIDYRDLVCARQVHSNKATCVCEKDKGRGALSYDEAIADSDALVTGTRGLPLAVFTADCLSVFLYDAKNKSIALVHAGWRGTKENIIASTLQLMRERFATKPADLYAGFGPAIGDCCYEVGKEFPDFFTYGLQNRGARYYLDLAGINKKQLLDLGVPEVNINDSSSCTSCHNANLFSFRKEGPSCGRMMSVAMLK
ncbi:MAG: peptidoglycan editing factor PgeF [Candidatus Omnitrophica bacterium]|nr:peptidoglycan editing factor PgeF [Candidatus Omnitrophota bacterium]